MILTQWIFTARFRPCDQVSMSFHRCCGRHSGSEEIGFMRDIIPTIQHYVCYSGIVVAVMCCTAAAACPVSVCQCEVIFYETTNAASFTGWIPLIDFGKSLSLRCEFVLKHRAEHAKAVIVGGFTKLQRASHTTKVYIFHKYGIILLGYRSTYRMAEVLALIGYMFMQKLNFM